MGLINYVLCTYVLGALMSGLMCLLSCSQTHPKKKTEIETEIFNTIRKNEAT